MNYSDALAPGICRADDRGVHAIFQDPAAVRLMDPAQDLDQRALSSTVLACKRMHPSSVQAEINVS